MHRVYEIATLLSSFDRSARHKAWRAALVVVVLVSLAGWLPARAAGPATRVADINTTGSFIPNNSSSPRGLTPVGSTLYFSADDGTNGRELWKTDGSASTAAMVEDIFGAPGASSNPTDLTDVNGTLFFAATDTVSDTELWKSDGTAAGTVLVKDIYAGAPDSSPGSLANVNGTLLFSVNDGASGRELWKSRGTAATNVQVQNIASGAGDSDPAGFASMGTHVFFSAADDTAGTELWSIPISGLNYAPSASNLTIATPLNTPASGTLPAVDPDGGSLTFSIVANGSKGAVVITNSATGAFIYTPNAGASGGDSFTFKVNDGQADSNTAIVNITIDSARIYLPIVRR